METIDAGLQSTIMQKIEEMLGKEKAVTDDRLGRIEDLLRTTFKAMPKNEQGKLEHAAVRYALHNYFVQRHGWYVRGLSDVGEAFNGTSPNGILQDRVEEFVQGVFEQRMGAHGLDLRETAVLAATFENLVRHETMQRLNASLGALSMRDPKDMNISQVDEVLATYMMSYVLRLDFAKSRPGTLNVVRKRINVIYPAWGETLVFLREVRAQSSYHRTHFSRTDVEDILEKVGDQYGRWQDRECRDLKHKLLSLEDKSIGTNGSGRVRMADFYGSAVNDGNWQFSETKKYLEQLGALDSQDPSIPRVVIPNYINSPSNCLAGSKYYSVCCINECEDLLDGLEHRFQAPTAAATEIVEAVTALPSSSVSAGRVLQPILLARLDEIAKHHGGEVPLHGRLFAQWMHHAYPRECPYPHMSGTVRAQVTQEYKAATNLSPIVPKAEISELVATLRAEQASSELDSSEECTTWSQMEELYVSGPAMQVRRWHQLVRPVAYFSIVAAVVLMLGRRVVSSGKTVAFFAGSFGGKDIFV